jgi:heat shock protein HslJ
MLAVFLVACGAQPNPQDLGKTEWTLVLLNGLSPVEGATATLNFFEDRLNGTTGCNVYTAGYSLRGKTLEVFDMVVTEQACPEPPGIMEQERVYLDILLNVTRILIEDDQVMLLTEDERFLLFDE